MFPSFECSLLLPKATHIVPLLDPLVPNYESADSCDYDQHEACVSCRLETKLIFCQVRAGWFLVELGESKSFLSPWRSTMESRDAVFQEFLTNLLPPKTAPPLIRQRLSGR